MKDRPSPCNLRMVVEYDGTAYAGWERQKNGLAIQEVLEEAVFSITGERVVLEASGRTDAGVHAEAQVVSFRLGKDIAPGKLRLALNAVIPQDLAVITLEEAPPEFHARKSATSKLYRYTLLTGPSRRPLLRHRVLHWPRPLDLAALEDAAGRLVGTRDFSAFAREADRKKSCVRTILRAGWRREGDLLHFEIEGTGFLYNMVRILVGTLIEIGLGRRPPEAIDAILASRARVDAGFTVPPHGLTLVSVAYDAPGEPGRRPGS